MRERKLRELSARAAAFQTDPGEGEYGVTIHGHPVGPACRQRLGQCLRSVYTLSTFFTPGDRIRSKPPSLTHSSNELISPNTPIFDAQFTVRFIERFTAKIN